MEAAFPTIASYLIQLPLFLVWLAGLILAVVFWKRHPRVSLLAVIALAGFLLVTAANIFLNLWLGLGLDRLGLSPAQIGLVYLVRNIVDGLLAAGLWGLVLAAIFAWRKQPQPPAA